METSHLANTSNGIESQLAPLHTLYKHVVSLGAHCQPAHQIRRITQNETAHVFDWIISPHHGVTRVLKDRFDGFFDRSRLVRNPQNRVVDRESGLQFLHDFQETEEIDSAYLEKREKYNHLVHRFLHLLAGTESVLFVRQHSESEKARERAIELSETIASAAPQLPFSLLYLTPLLPGTPTDWSDGRVIFRTMPRPETRLWTGDDNAWDKALSDPLSVEPPSGTSR